MSTQASATSWSSPFSVSAPSAAAAAAVAPSPTDMAAVLQQVLERTEPNKLPKSVQNKLEKFLADQQSETDGLKGRHEKFKVESGKYDALPAHTGSPWVRLPWEVASEVPGVPGILEALSYLLLAQFDGRSLFVCFCKSESTFRSVFFVTRVHDVTSCDDLGLFTLD